MPKNARNMTSDQYRNYEQSESVNSNLAGEDGSASVGKLWRKGEEDGDVVRTIDYRKQSANDQKGGRKQLGDRVMHGAKYR
jgi:hypothetical protein